MKRILTITLATAILLMCLGATALAASYVRISGNCHVRTGPGTWYESIGIANKGSSLTYKGNSSYVDGRTWYNVKFNGKNGWVSSAYAYLSDKGGITTYGAGGTGGSEDGYYSGSFAYGSNVYISKGNCNVRSGPSLSHSTLGTAHNGDVLYGTGDISTDSRGVKWYSVRFKGYDGWVSSVYASLSGSSSSSGAKSGTVVATSGSTNVRTGPGLWYMKLGVLSQGHSATYKGSTSVDDRGVPWYKISWNGGTGWVSSKYTTLY